MPLTAGGPLLRYSQLPSVLKPSPYLWKSRQCLLDIGAGIAKLAGGVALAGWQTALLSAHGSPGFWSKLLVALLSAPGGFYLVTAGYFQFMEGLALPVGITLPPSFNYPIGRENIAMFWANWNMTATAVFKDYLFYNRWGFQRYNIYLNTIVLFTLVGLWHAANAYWLLWGFLHGILFSGYLAWRHYVKPVTHDAGRWPVFSKLWAPALTYVAVCSCWYLPSKIIGKMGRL